ncbi:AAA family ATPase [Bdellovibrionota bacterium FG-2]
MADKPDFIFSISEKARRGELDVCVGRERDIENLENLLNSEASQSVLLLGPAGVGKTELVRGLAQALVDRQAECELYELDLTSFEANTKYVGELQSKLDQLYAFAAAKKKAVFFIDEFHSLIGIGTSTGKSSGIEQNLKVAMTSGRLHVIAATTDKEFERFVAGDSALARRFARWPVSELSEETTLLVLKRTNQTGRVRGLTYFTEGALRKIVTTSRSIYPNVANPARSIKIYNELRISFGTNKQKDVAFNTEPAKVLAALAKAAGPQTSSVEINQLLSKFISVPSQAPREESEVINAVSGMKENP